MSEIKLFENDEFALRLTPTGDTFTASAPDIARALGFRDAARLVESIPDEEKGYTLSCTPGGNQRVWYLTEAGFYRAIGQRQPARIRDATVRGQVARFQAWVYAEVLPAIRRTGTYRTPMGVDAAAPDTYTYDEVCGVLRQHFGVNLTVNELTRNLRSGGVLKQNGAPTKKYAHLFWFTGTAWNVHRHVVPQLAYRVYETGRELQDFRFIQARLQLDGVGWSLERA